MLHFRDKQVVIMWVWILNEQRYSFRWIFQVALPSLIPNHVSHRVKFVMKDRDPQARNELLISLISIFPNAKEGGCLWHILHQGMKNRVSGTTIVTKSDQKMEFCTIQDQVMGLQLDEAGLRRR